MRTRIAGGLFVSHLGSETDLKSHKIKGKPIGHFQPVFYIELTADRRSLVIMLPSTVSGLNIKKSHRTYVRCDFFYISKLGFT